MMKTRLRIVGGLYKGRFIEHNNSQNLEPTKSIVKEALFNIIGNAIQGSIFLDLFSGTGNIGFEAMSRGAKQVYFVERQFRCVEGIRLQINKLKKGTTEVCHTHVLNRDVYAFLKSDGGIKADYVFCDPPYMDATHRKQLLASLARSEYIKEDTQLIFEHRYPLKKMDEWHLIQERCYSKTRLSFFIKNNAMNNQEIDKDES